MKRYAFILISFLLLLTSGVATAGERMAVSGEVANVRARPDTNADVLWQVEKYYPLVVIEEKGAWYRFKDFEGDMGWIHDSLVDKTPTVIVKVNRANVRNGPGTQFDLIFDANRGTPFKVLQEKGRWLQIEHADGDRGWIFKSLTW